MLILFKRPNHSFQNLVVKVVYKKQYKIINLDNLRWRGGISKTIEIYF